MRFSQIIFVSTVKFQSLYTEAKGIETVKVIFSNEAQSIETL